MNYEEEKEVGFHDQMMMEEDNEVERMSLNSKKRKRSEVMTPTSMVLRSKVKRRKIEGEEMMGFPKRTSSNSNLNGASYLKYDIVEKKDGRKTLVPVRYSIRN